MSHFLTHCNVAKFDPFKNNDADFMHNIQWAFSKSSYLVYMFSLVSLVQFPCLHEIKMNLLPMHQQASHVKSSCKYVQIKSEQSEAFLEISRKNIRTRSSWFNCALRDDEAVCWVSIGYCEALAVGN